MKICHVAPELLPVPPTRGGAIERWIRDAAGRLAARGHEVLVVSRDHGDGATSLVDGGVRYHFIPLPSRIDSGLPAALTRGFWYYNQVRRVVSAIAPDVVCLAMNYLFFSLQRSGRLEGAFEVLWRRFWERYRERSGDRRLLDGPRRISS